MADEEVQVLKLEHITNLVWFIFAPLLVIILIFSFVQYGFGSWYEYFWLAGIAVFLGIPMICIIIGAVINILSALNIVKTDGNWGTLDIMKSFFSELYSEDIDEDK